MTTNYKKLFSGLDEIKLTENEKNSLRLKLSQYMHQHPIGSRPSFYTFRYMTTAALALVLFIGTGGAVTFASQNALPGQSLYAIKKTTEDLKKITLKTPAEKASYELTLIDKRFSETNQLISEQALTDKNQAIIIESIKKHTEDLKQETATLAMTNPAEALAYNTKLTNTLKTGTHILLALSQQQNQILAKADSVSPNTLVLAAYASAEKITADKKQLESMVLSDTNGVIIKTAEKKYSETLALLEKENIPTAVIVNEPEQPSEPSQEPVVALMAFSARTVESTQTVEAPMAKLSVIEETPEEKLQKLIIELRNAYENKQYAQVIVISEKIQQQLHDAKKIQEVENVYNVVIPAIDQNEESIIDELSVEPITEDTQEGEITPSTQN